MAWIKTPSGYAITSARITRAGEVEYYGHELGLYGQANKKIPITRTLDELTKPETLASFEGQTLTPPDSGKVTADEWKDKAIGHIQNVRAEGATGSAESSAPAIPPPPSDENADLKQQMADLQTQVDKLKGGQETDAVLTDVKSRVPKMDVSKARTARAVSLPKPDPALSPSCPPLGTVTQPSRPGTASSHSSCWRRAPS